MNELPINKYMEAETSEREARERLAAIIEKQSRAAENVEQLAGAAKVAQQAAAAKMQDYLVGRTGEDGLTTARQDAESAERRHRDALDLSAAIGEALSLQRKVVEDAARLKAHARDVFWRTTMEAEKQAFLAQSRESISRAYALAFMFAIPGSAWQVTPRSVVGDIIGEMVVTDSQRDAALEALAKEYGVPLH